MSKIVLTNPETAEAVSKLQDKRDELADAVATANEATALLRQGIVEIRPSGLLTVDEMAEAVGRDRSYVDSVWFESGATQKGKQTRVAVENADPKAAREAYDTLHKLADDQRRTEEREKRVRAERDGLVASVYAAKTLGPSAIAAAVGVDRNHVLFIARRAGIKPKQREITPEAAGAVSKLRAKRDELADAVVSASEATAALRDGIIHVRPLGLLTVDEMTEAVARDRNYVDSVWSTFGDTQKGKQTRVAVENADPEAARTAYDTLHKLADDQRRTAEREKAARAERDALVASVYAAKTLGPSAIAAEVGVDRNHVLRIARRAGIKPQHRKIARNQYTAK